MANQLSKKTRAMYEVIADIAYMAGHYGYYSGDSRADMDKFIELAETFSKTWKQTERNDYMTDIEKFTIRKLKLNSKLILHYPKGLEAWKELIIEKCREEKGSTFRVSEYPSEAEDKPNDFWSIYAIQNTGHSMCVADVPTEKAAVELHNTIVDAVRNFKGDKRTLKRKEFNP